MYIQICPTCPPISNTGQYSETFQNSFGCDSIVSVFVEVIIVDAIVLPPAPILCDPLNFTTLDGSLSQDPNWITYQWTGPSGFASNEAVATPVYEGGIYTLQVTAVAGTAVCQDDVTVEVVVMQDFAICRCWC